MNVYLIEPHSTRNNLPFYIFAKSLQTAKLKAKEAGFSQFEITQTTH